MSKFAYSGGTFRVGSGKFAFNSDKNIKIFPRSRSMWYELGIWDKFRNILSGTSGSEEGAKKIEVGLQFLDMPQKDQKEKLTEDEMNLINEILKETGGDYSFLGFKSSISAKLRGEQFEQRIAKLLSRLTDTPETEINVGQHQTRSKVEERIIIDTSSLSKNYKQVDLWSIIKKQTGYDYQNFIDNAIARINQGFGTKNTSVVIRSGTRFGKVDIDGSQCGAIIEADLHPVVREMAEEMVGHTLSLKNYQKSTLDSPNFYHRRGWGGVSLGYASDFRAYSSFYSGVTGDNNFANTCTFIFASSASKDKVVKRYMSWARFIFELTGLGLTDITDPNSKTMVDYLVINTANSRSYGRIKVLWIGSLFQGLPNSDPPYKKVDVLTSSGSTEKWIFGNFSFNSD